MGFSCLYGWSETSGDSISSTNPAEERLRPLVRLLPAHDHAARLPRRLVERCSLRHHRLNEVFQMRGEHLTCMHTRSSPLGQILFCTQQADKLRKTYVSNEGSRTPHSNRLPSARRPPLVRSITVGIGHRRGSGSSTAESRLRVRSDWVACCISAIESISQSCRPKCPLKIRT